MSLPKVIGTVRRARVPDEARWRAACAAEVRELMAILGARGMTMLDVGEAIGASRSALYRWRTGQDDVPGSKLLALRALAAEVAGRKVAL